MKQLLITFLYVPLFCISQTPYAKISPSLFLPTDNNIGLYIKPAVKNQSIGGFASGGLVLHKYLAAGLVFGYFKPIDFKTADIKFDKPVIPVGFDFTITDFTKKKIKPLLQFQAMYPIHKQTYTYTDGSGNDFGEAKITGSFMFSLSGGISIPITAKKKMFFTGGYSNLTLRDKRTNRSISSGIIIFSASIFI